MINKYPTKEEILDAPTPQINTTTIALIFLWKRDFFKKWKTLSIATKLKRLEYLVNSIVQLSLPRSKSWIFCKLDNAYNYNTETKTLYQDKNNPSILSTLHEIGHHIYGRNELKACVWSIKIFTICFPELYKNLEWKGHLLVKKN